MYTIRTTFRVAALAVLAAAAASCADGPAERLTQPQAAALAASAGPMPLVCPSSTTASATSTIGVLGGVIEAAGHRAVIPPNAVLLPTEFTMTVPASQYVEVDIGAAGMEHFEFLKPVALTLSYERCARANINRENLRIYYIDSQTREILEDLGGVDDKNTRTVTAATGHFSGYLIGQGRSQDSDTTAAP